MSRNNQTLLPHSYSLEVCTFELCWTSITTRIDGLGFILNAHGNLELFRIMSLREGWQLKVAPNKSQTCQCGKSIAGVNGVPWCILEGYGT